MRHRACIDKNESAGPFPGDGGVRSARDSFNGSLGHPRAQNDSMAGTLRPKENGRPSSLNLSNQSVPGGRFVWSRWIATPFSITPG